VSRDDFSAKTKDVLAARVAYRCSNPGCRRPTSGPQDEPTKTINVGVAAHITGAAPGGPRYDHSLTTEDRCGVGNGIWLCQTCAKLIDSDLTRYSVLAIREWKLATELAAKRALEKDGTARIASWDSWDRIFSKVESLMPELVTQMRRDLTLEPCCREFVVLSKTLMFWYPDRKMFTYYSEDHDDLDSKLIILENFGLIRDIRHNRVPRFAIKEELAAYLSS
jgi:hypothetical protein